MNEFSRLLLNPAYHRMRGGRRLHYFRLLTSAIRVLPDFIIIGAQKSGTTSLYWYLVHHPLVARAATKEPDFFDRFYRRGLLWYRAHFVTAIHTQLARVKYGQKMLAGEASVNYMWHPSAPQRIARDLPAVKLIVLLRNPIDRAYSNYQMECRKGRETLPFDQAISHEPERIGGEMRKMRADEEYYSLAYRHHAYLAKGRYVEHLENWLPWFPRDHILFLKSEDFYHDVSACMKRVLGFLGLPPYSLPAYRKYSVGRYPEMDAATRVYLQGYFRPYNARLAELLGVDLGWDD